MPGPEVAWRPGGLGSVVLRPGLVGRWMGGVGPCPLRVAGRHGRGVAPCLFSLVCPTFARQQMDLWSFQRLTQVAPLWAEQLAGYHGPLGAAVGIALGAIAGAWLGARPTGEGELALVLVRWSAFALGTSDLAGLGASSYQFIAWSISDGQISITGMIFGARLGSARQCNYAMYTTRSRRTPRPATHSERSGTNNSSREPQSSPDT